MEAAVPARVRPKLTDVLGLLAMQGQADIVARVGLGLNRATWNDPDLWRACINVVFGETKMNANSYVFESTARTRLMAYLERGRVDLVELALSYRADPNLNITYLHEDKMCTIRTPLQCAIEKKIYSLVGLLLKHGADPNKECRPDSHITSKKTLLELASEKDSLSIVRLLVDEYGAKVPGAFPLAEVVPLAKIPLCQPLSSAIEQNNLSMVRYFVDTKGVRMNYPNPENFEWSEEEQKWDDEEHGMIDEGDLVSYLEAALSMGAASISLEMVTLFLDAGAVMNFIGANFESPLYMAVDRGRMDVVTLLLARGADPNLARDWTQESPIIVTARKNDLQMATVLVGAGANVLATIHYEDMQDIDDMMVEGYTALHHFAERRNTEGVALMLQEGAEIDALTFSGLTPLLLITKGVGKKASAVRIAAACARCRLLVNAGANVNHVRVLHDDFYEFDNSETEESRFSALTYATELNAPALVRCLIELGADVTQCAEHSFSLLMRAADRGHVEVLEILLAAAQTLSQAKKTDFLDKKYQDEDSPEEEWNGRNALHLCMNGDNPSDRARCANILIDAGVSAMRTDRIGLTPFLLVAKGLGVDSSVECIAAACACCRLLISAEANVNSVLELPIDFYELRPDIQDYLGVKEESRFSALTYATEHNAPALVQSLIELGADITHCAKNSFTLLMRAADKGHVEVLAILVAAMKSLPQTQRAAFLDKMYQDESNPEDVRNGRNALHFCMMCDNPSDRARCANILIDAGVPALIRDRRGKTPLDLALQTNSANIVKMILVASRLQHADSVIDVSIFSWQTTLTIGGVPYSAKVNAFSFLVMNGLTNLCAHFCSRLTKAQIDQAYKCEAQVECVGSDGVASFEVRTAHYSALTLALQHSDACAKVLIDHGASPLPPSPLSGLPDLSLANSPLMQAIEKDSGELASLLATSLLRRGLATNVLVQAVQSASAPAFAALLAAMKRRPGSGSLHPLTPKPGGVAESPLVDALRLKNLKMARAIVASMDAWQLGLTDPDPEPRDVKLCFEVKVPAFVYRNPWVKVPAGPGQTVSVNFLGWELEYRIPHGAAPGQTVRIAETISWRPPPTSALDVVLRLIAAEDTSERHRKQLRSIAETLLAQKCKVTDSHLDLLIYCAQLGSRAEEVFNLVSKCKSADHMRERDNEGKEWMNEGVPPGEEAEAGDVGQEMEQAGGGDEEEEQEVDEEVEDEEELEEEKEEEEPLSWERAVSNDWPGTGNDKCRFVGLV